MYVCIFFVNYVAIFVAVKNRLFNAIYHFLPFVKVEIGDAIRCDEIFSLCMGDDVEPRREFIEQNAKYATNLDV